MSIRKTRLHSRSKPQVGSESRAWPYPVLRQTVAVQKDGSIRIPASLVRMIAEEGEKVSVTFFSDSHVEVEGEAGRTATPPLTPGARLYDSDEEFIAALEPVPFET